MKKIVVPLPVQQTEMTEVSIDGQDVPSKEDIDEIDKQVGYVPPVRKQSASLPWYVFVFYAKKKSYFFLHSLSSPHQQYYIYTYTHTYIATPGTSFWLFVVKINT